jgi:hypothetical protein
VQQRPNQRCSKCLAALPPVLDGPATSQLRSLCAMFGCSIPSRQPCTSQARLHASNLLMLALYYSADTCRALCTWHLGLISPHEQRCCTQYHLPQLLMLWLLLLLLAASNSGACPRVHSKAVVYPDGHMLAAYIDGVRAHKWHGISYHVLSRQ